jgi:hypothetical protein
MRSSWFHLAILGIIGSGGLAMAAQEAVPFTAAYDDLKVLKNPDGTEVVAHDLGRIWRDGRGRLRYEFKDEEVGRTIAVLIDPASGRIGAFDAVSGERLDARSDRVGARLEAKMPRVHAGEDSSRGSEQFKPIESTSLGEKVIEGLVSRGHRIQLANGSVTEVWHATSLPDFPLVSRATGPSGREESRLINVRIGEPDLELFAPLDSVDRAAPR